MRHWTLAVCAAALAVLPAAAQEREKIRMLRTDAGQPEAVYVAEKAGFGTIAFSAFGQDDGGMVKGAPFSAETVSEFRQTLGDGNQIERRSSGALYRDGEGRRRRETPVGGLGPFAPAEAKENLISIIDPVAGTQVFLHTARKTATQVQALKARTELREKIRVAEGTRVEVVAPRMEQEQVKTEDLGTRNFDAVRAVGKRTTFTIPAGQVGNVRPIELVDEVWFSPDLKVEVMTRHSDPRSGEQIYQLRGIRLGEPPRDLFQIPADYTVENSAATFTFTPGQRVEGKAVWVEKKNEQ